MFFKIYMRNENGYENGIKVFDESLIESIINALNDGKYYAVLVVKHFIELDEDEIYFYRELEKPYTRKKKK